MGDVLDGGNGGGNGAPYRGGWLSVYYRIFGMRSIRISDEQAASLKKQLASGWSEDTVLCADGVMDTLRVRAADLAAMVFRPNARSPRFDGFQRWWFDLESGSRLGGIASDESWAAFDKAAKASRKDGQLLFLRAGSHEVFVVAEQLSAWRGVSDAYGFDAEEDGGGGQNYRGGDRGNGYRGEQRNGGGNRRYAILGYGNHGGGRRGGSWDR